jgi:hypothetical protein
VGQSSNVSNRVSASSIGARLPGYGDLKHDSSLNYDANEIYLLAETGRILLACAPLNRIAMNKAQREQRRDFTERQWPQVKD